jgi:shikimate dehydrogenase
MKKHYGLIGHPLGHTLSPYIHRQIMKDCGVDGTYKAYDLDPGLTGKKIPALMRKLDGFNVTIPYKQSILPFLSGIDESGRQYGAVNTVFGRRGFNTDILGFSGLGIVFDRKRVLLLGAGGSARIMLYEVVRAGAREIVICTRRPVQAQSLLLEVKENTGFERISFCERNRLTCDYDVILNATPVGMWPECDGMPVQKSVLAGAEYVFDAIYNPLSTKLVLAARSMGIKAQSGLAMLYSQAVEAQRIWNPDADFSNLSPLIQQFKLKQRLLKLFPVKFVLTGFMGSGKTTVGKTLSKILHIGFVDLDLRIVEEKKKPIYEIFKSEGEESFRETERLCLSQAVREERSLVIATGGGAAMDRDNVEVIRRHQGFIIFLSVELETILQRIGGASGERPLFNGSDLDQVRRLYDSRTPVYNSIADLVVDANGEVSDVASAIKFLLDG